MLSPFLLCSGCSRHFRRSEHRCPFCGKSATGAAARSAPKPLGAGASRSRRYAAGAALLATSAFIGCSGESSSSGAGAKCEGATEPTGTPCHQTSDCMGLAMCVTQTPSSGCGNPAFLPQQCQADVDCPNDGVCQFDSCGGSTCQPACDPTACTSASACVNNRCVPKRCDEAGAAPCGAGTQCEPTAPGAAPSGCAPVHCTSGTECEANFDCVASAPGSGCVQRACSVDLECDCGYCVNGTCQPTLGFCYEIVAMPYGCVWPDEELV